MLSCEVAALQLRADADHARCMDQATRSAEAAIAGGAQWVFLPENYAGMAWPDPRQRPVVGGAPEHASALAPLVRLTTHTAATIIAGGTPERADEGRVYNTAFVLRRGRVVARYRKLHLFDADVPGQPPLRESDEVAPGAGAVVVELPEGCLGLSICYDVRFSELYRELAEAGADAIAVPAAFTEPTGRDHWEVLLRARAIETQCFVVAAAQWGAHGRGRHSWGHAMIIDPWGRVLADAGGDADAIVRARLDPAALTDARARLPVARHRIDPSRRRVTRIDARHGLSDESAD